MEIQNMTFFGIEPFDANSKCNRNPGSVSVTVSFDQITIPNYTFKKFGYPKFVEVGFNNQKNIFAIKPVDKETKYSIEVNISGSQQIIRKSITDRIHELRGWDWENMNLVLKNGNYDSETGYWLFDLDGGEEIEKRRRTHGMSRRK